MLGSVTKFRIGQLVRGNPPRAYLQGSQAYMSMGCSFLESMDSQPQHLGHRPDRHQWSMLLELLQKVPFMLVIPDRVSHLRSSVYCQTVSALLVIAEPCMPASSHRINFTLEASCCQSHTCAHR